MECTNLRVEPVFQGTEVTGSYKAVDQWGNEHHHGSEAACYEYIKRVRRREQAGYVERLSWRKANATLRSGRRDT